MPPARPTTAESTTHTRRSRFARTAAKPPLRPKTNVPARLRTRMSVGLKPAGTSIASSVSPGRAPAVGVRRRPGAILVGVGRRRPDVATEARVTIVDLDIAARPSARARRIGPSRPTALLVIGLLIL